MTELELNAERLRAGGLVYPYESADVTVRLKVITTGREVTESTRVFGVDRDANSPWMAPALSETAETPPASQLTRKRLQRRAFRRETAGREVSATPSESRTDVELSRIGNARGECPRATLAFFGCSVSCAGTVESFGERNSTPGTVRAVPQDCRDREPARRNRHAPLQPLLPSAGEKERDLSPAKRSHPLLQ